MNLLRVSIPQAVSTVATGKLGSHRTGAMVVVSIPQAVSTVATFLKSNDVKEAMSVSIPQAVSTVATFTVQ